MVPTASLAAILVFTGYKLVNVQNVRRLLRYGGAPVVIYAATVIGIVTTDLLKGILLGLALSILNVIYARTHFGVRLQPHDDGRRLDVYLVGAATFLRLPKFADALEAIPAEHETHVHLRDLDYVDDACLEALSAWQNQRTQKGAKVVIEWNEALRLYKDKNPLGSYQRTDIVVTRGLALKTSKMEQVSISKILLPVDFSRRAEGAVRSAHRLAAHFHAELMLLHVVEPFHVDFAMVEPFQDSLRDLAQAKWSKKQAELDAFALHDLQGVTVTRTLCEGDPAGKILECSRIKRADVIVMPTQGHGRLHGLLIGSVTAKVLDQSDIPVLTGTHLEQEGDLTDWHVRKILCAVDLGTRTNEVLGWGAALAKEFQADVTVLHVSSEPDAMNCLAKAIGIAGLQAAALTANGDPHKVVARTAAQLDADLVIIGRGTATDTLGRLRAEAYGIVRQSPCPVLSV